MPIVSIIMPAYNADRFIREAIDSVLSQTYEDWELIVVDDCSEDKTATSVKEFADDRIRLLQNEKNLGVAASRNKGIAEAKGSYIAFLDGDDLWRACKLKVQMDLIADRSDVLCYTSYDFISENGDSVKTPYIVPCSTNYDSMLDENVIGCSSVVLSKSLLSDVPEPFDGEFYHEDYVLWMDLLRRKSVTTVGVEEVLMSHRQVATARSISKKKAAVERWKIYRDKLKMSKIQSLSHFLKYALRGIKKYG